MHVPGGRVLAFESKNKRQVTKGDVDKFYRDIDAMPTCVGAMFVSLVSPNIPGKSHFLVEVYKGIPVLFVGFESFEECDRYFPSYASVLVSLSSHCESLLNDTSSDATSRLDAVLTELAPLVDRVRLLRNDATSVSTCLRGLQRTVDGMQSHLEGLFCTIDRLVGSSSSSSVVSSLPIPPSDVPAVSNVSPRIPIASSVVSTVSSYCCRHCGKILKRSCALTMHERSCALL
jgi:hypothetical protein